MHDEVSSPRGQISKEIRIRKENQGKKEDPRAGHRLIE